MTKYRSFAYAINSFTQKQMIEDTAFSRSTVQRVMKELTEQGYIERVGSKKAGSWIVKK